MRHVFKELNEGIEKRANMPGMGMPGAGGVDQGAPPAPSGGQPQPVDPMGGAAAPNEAGMPQGQGQWAGPKLGAFPNKRTTLDMKNPQEIMAAAIESVSGEFDYLANYPMEPRIDKEDGNVVVGSVMVAVPQGVNVAVPFVVNDGVMQPPVAIFVGEDYHAIPRSETKFAELVGSPAPVIGTSTNKKMMPSAQDSTGKQDLSKGPDDDATDQASNNQRKAVLGELQKQAAFLDYIAGTPFGRKVGDLIAADQLAVQYERVPFGVIEKKADAGSFDPVARKIPMDRVSPSILKGFSERTFFTVVAEPGILDDSLEKTAASRVTLLNYEDLKPGMGIRAAKDGVKFNLRVVKQKGWDENDPDILVAVSEKGHCVKLSSSGNASKKWVEGRPPAIKAGDIEDMWRYPGRKLVVVCGKNRIFRPLGIIKKNRVYLGDYFSKHSVLGDNDKSADVVVSSTIVEPTLHGSRLFLPEDAKVFYIDDSDSWVDTGIEKVASRSFPENRVAIVRHRLGVTLQGQPVAKAKWDGEDMEKTAMSMSDAVFVLGAMGVPEETALEKVAATSKKPQEVLVTRSLVTEDLDYDVDLGFMKLAAALPQQEDELLAIQMMGSDTLQLFQKKLPDLYALADNLAKLTLAAQIGMEPVDPDTAYQATKNVQLVGDQLSQLGDMGSGEM